MNKCGYTLNITAASSEFDSFRTDCGRVYFKLQNFIYFPSIVDEICPYCGKEIEIIE